MYIRKDDVVQVMTGDDRGTRAKVLRVFRSQNKVLVEGVNKVYRHLKPSQRNPQGGRLSKEMPINASNVMLVDPVTGKPSRLGVRYLADGSKELFFKKSGTRVRLLTKANPKYARQAQPALASGS